MPDITPRQHQIMGLLLARPRGMSIDAIAAACGLQRGWTKEALGQLRKLGLALPTSRGGWHVVWTTSERQPVLSKIISERVKAKERAAARRRYKRNANDRQLRSWLRIEQRSIPAAKAAPIPITGPISVFHLAGHYQGDIHA